MSISEMILCCGRTLFLYNELLYKYDKMSFVSMLRVLARNIKNLWALKKL